MRNFQHNINVWRDQLSQRPLAIFLDYDGTLSVLALTPGKARLTIAMRDTLTSLARLEGVKLAIVSGRAWNDLYKRVAVPGIAYIGSHGIEFLSPRSSARDVPKHYLRELQKLKRVCAEGLSCFHGILLEVKPFSLAIHYRKAIPDAARKARKVVFNICREDVRMKKIALLTGKKIIEIMPPGPLNKGSAVLCLLRMWRDSNILPIYIGDDQTDETAFSVLRGLGLTIKVGSPNRRSDAEYFLKSVNEVRMLLRIILRDRSQKMPPLSDRPWLQRRSGQGAPGRL